MPRLRTRLRRLATGLLLALVLVPPAQVLLLRWLDPPLTTTMLEARRIARAQGNDDPLVHAHPPLSELGPHLPRAVVASEDARFWLHRGFDPQGICAALRANRARRGEARPVGGSTISQQTARNVFLWQEASWLRKGLETVYTVWLELLVPKERILEVYLGVAETGVLSFGVEAGAQRYFDQPAWALTEEEAARIAAVLPSPRRWEVQGGAVTGRARWILQNPAPWPGDADFAAAEAAWTEVARDGWACVLRGGR